jgi:hypothetical protein
MEFHRKEALVDSIIALRRQADTQMQREEYADARASLEALVKDCDTWIDAAPCSSWIVDQRRDALRQLEELK